MKIVVVPVEKVVAWDRNPRKAEPEDLARLKAQIVKFGQYKPLLAYAENGRYVVLGGNMRLQVLKELGVEKVHLSVVKPKDEAEKIELNVSDNDRAGFYDEQALAELLWDHKADIDCASLMIDLSSDVPLAQVLESGGKAPGQAEVYGSDKKEGVGPLICPNCGAVVEEKEIDGD